MSNRRRARRPRHRAAARAAQAPAPVAANERADSRDRARRHRLRGRRAAAPDRRPPAASRSPRCCRTASRASRWRQGVPAPGAAPTPTRASSPRREIEDAAAQAPRRAVFSAAPHGVSAALIDALLTARGARRHAAARRRHLGGLPLRHRRRLRGGVQARARRARSACAQFTCARAGAPAEARHAARRRIRAASPPRSCSRACRCSRSASSSRPLFVSGVTGSTGSGRKPTAGTHHPLRHSDLYSYNALQHRHAPEVAACAQAAAGVEAQFAFVPHSGPVRARHPRDACRRRSGARSTPRSCSAILREYYARRPVRARHAAGAAPQGRGRRATTRTSPRSSMAARSPCMCAIDNLNKGAAGGAVQWMNRMFGLPESSGLTAPAPGWT